MPKLSFALSALVACLLALPQLGSAQLIRVEPGYVKAPFVRVHRTPDGGRRVRAPFTEVYRPGYAEPQLRNDRQGYENLPAPPHNDASSTNVPGTPQDRTRHQLATAARDLDHDLGQMLGGQQWQTYLRLPSSVFAGTQANQPTPIELSVDTADLEHVLTRFTQIANDEQYHMIAQLPSFQATHQHLVAYLNVANQPPALPAPPAPPRESEEVSLLNPNRR
ncbi:MAG: hypothetical protein GTO03_17205 [Planctomycetales bacterium]|nr:hypothetical protein [Planctomycetales bacterium]